MRSYDLASPGIAIPGELSHQSQVQQQLISLALHVSILMKCLALGQITITTISFLYCLGYCGFLFQGSSHPLCIVFITCWNISRDSQTRHIGSNNYTLLFSLSTYQPLLCGWIVIWYLLHYTTHACERFVLPTVSGILLHD